MVGPKLFWAPNVDTRVFVKLMKQQLTNFVLLANRHYDKSFSASAQPQRDPNTSPKVNWLSTDNLNRIFSFGENNANAIYEDPD